MWWKLFGAQAFLNQLGQLIAGSEGFDGGGLAQLSCVIGQGCFPFFVKYGLADLIAGGLSNGAGLGIISFTNTT